MPLKVKTQTYKECDLYPPLKKFLESQGYTVKGEINNCDAVAVRGSEEPLIIELKLVLNLKVLLQCVSRLTITSNVYVGICSQCKTLSKDRAAITKLFRMLGLGLISINPRGRRAAVQILIDPGDYQPRKTKRAATKLLGEFVKLIGDPNLGGIGRRKGIMTVYRQRALSVAGYLQENGSSKASVIAKAVADPKAREILYTNVYGWFERGTTGIYSLSPKGVQEIVLWQTDK